MKNFISFFVIFFIAHSLDAIAADEKIDKILKDFETYAEKARKEWNVQGMAIAIIKNDKILLSKGYGQRGIKDKRPVDENTLFQIGSLSKAFTSALVAREVDKGWIKWEDKVIDHTSNFHLADPWATAQFQVDDLLSQRSGLPSYSGDSLLFLGYSKEDIFKNLRFLKPISSFRSQYAYQNIPFAVASTIIEQKTNKSYPQLLKQEFFIPLEMTHSSATLKEYLSNDNRAEWLMHLKDGSIYHLQDDFSEAEWNYIVGAAGAINSTVKDMANWMIFQANQGLFNGKQLISQENMKRMTRPMIYVGKTDNDHDLYYALGWVFMEYPPHPIIWHNGSTLGVFNLAAFIAEEKLGIVILTNGRNTDLATALTFQFFDIYFNKPDHNWSQKFLAKFKEKNKTIEEKIKNRSSSLPLVKYTGIYHHDVFGAVEVKIEDQQLSFILGKKQQKFTLKHWDRDIFTAAWPEVDFDGDSPLKILFMMDDKGKINQMTIEAFTKEGLGSFNRLN